MTLFEQCVEAVDIEFGMTGPDDLASSEAITRAVLTCLLENTGSPRTVDELTRVLAEAPQDGVYVA